MSKIDNFAMVSRKKSQKSTKLTITKTCHFNILWTFVIIYSFSDFTWNQSRWIENVSVAKRTHNVESWRNCSHNPSSKYKYVWREINVLEICIDLLSSSFHKNYVKSTFVHKSHWKNEKIYPHPKIFRQINYVLS